MPPAVRIREVGLRDGLQNEPEVLPTEDKLRLMRMLADAGVARMEATSLVRPDVVPQLADAEALLRRAPRSDEVSLSVLVPNARGLARALACHGRFDEIAVVVSASETHNRRNVRRSVAESLDELDRVLPAARDAGLRCEAVIATAFGCPYEGRVAPERVLAMARRLVAAGAHEVAFGDTTGMANPVQVARLFAAALAALDAEVTAHFHNTRGAGLANVLAALGEGCRSYESSFGEIGGCPVPPGATGNIATEDLVSMLHEMGVETGIDLERLLAASHELQRLLGRALGAHTLTAGPVDWTPAAP